VIVGIFLLALCCAVWMSRQRRHSGAKPVPTRDYSIDKENPAYGMTAGPASKIHGGAGAVVNTIYTALEPSERSPPTHYAQHGKAEAYVDIAPSPPTADPVYGTAIFRRGTAGLHTNDVYVGEAATAVRDGAVANAVYTEMPATGARDPDSESSDSMDAQHFYPGGAYSVVDPALLPSTTSTSQTLTATGGAASGIAVHSTEQSTPKEPLYADMPVDATAELPLETPMYMDGPVVPPVASSPYAVPQRFGMASGGGTGAAGHYTAEAPVYLNESETPASEPTYMTAADNDDSEYMENGGTTTTASTSTLASRRQKSQTATVPMPLLKQGGASEETGGPITPSRHFDEEGIFETQAMPAPPGDDALSRRASISSVTSRMSLV